MIKKLLKRYLAWRKKNSESNSIRGTYKFQGGWVSIAGLALSAYSAYNASQSSGGGGGSAQAAADPFGPYRGQYAQALNNFLLGGGGTISQPSGVAQSALPSGRITMGQAQQMAPGLGMDWNQVMDMFNGTNLSGVQMARVPGGAPSSSPTGGGMADIVSSLPGYQSQFQGGIDALARGGAASGRGTSGAELGSLLKYGQDTASANWSNYVNILSQLSGASWQSGPAAANANLLTQQMQNQQFSQGLGGMFSSAQNLYNNWGTSGIGQWFNSSSGGSGAGWNPASGPSYGDTGSTFTW